MGGGKVMRQVKAAAASIIVLGTALLAGSCANPLNAFLRAMKPLVMIYVDGGPLELGSDTSGVPKEGPAHTVTVNSFLMSSCEITQGVYERVMGNNPSYFSYDPTLPVEQVSWLNAVKFCNALSTLQGYTPCYTIDEPANTVWVDPNLDGYRLPTEAEWEYAARGGLYSGSFPYAGSITLDEVAWNAANSDNTTHPVGELMPNELGLYDMSGNVAEWCWDGFDAADYSTNYYTINTYDYYTFLFTYEPVLNPFGPNGWEMRYDPFVIGAWCPNPVNRGGDYYYSSDYCRTTSRDGSHSAEYQPYETGIRVVRKP